MTTMMCRRGSRTVAREGIPMAPRAQPCRTGGDKEPAGGVDADVGVEVRCIDGR